ncbi:hypothetical protein ACFSQD_09080 [Flavihumibacter stibioxidans]|nr:hypothetical protein [Flavihumibacter stibioxidans]
MLPTRKWPVMLLAVMVVISSCGLAGVADRLEYDFDEGNTKYRLVMAIPDGFRSELHTRDEQGNSVRTFRYHDGSRLYIACREQSDKPALAIDKNQEAMDLLTNSVGPLGEGTNPDGTRWRRTKKGGFILGYDFADPEKAKQYDKAILSMRIRK